MQSGAYDRAAQQLKEAQSLMSSHGLGDPALYYALYDGLAQIARFARDFATAEQHTREAASYAAEAGEHHAEATLLQNLAIFLGQQGRLDEARPFFLKAMAIVDKHAPGHPARLEFAINYAGWLFRTGEIDASVALIRDTLSALSGTPDSHLWAYANRDLATYAFATGEIDHAVRAHRHYLEAVPELYGEDSPAVASAGVVFARHLSFGGLHPASLAVIQRAYDSHPAIGNYDLAAYQAELRIDAGLVDEAVRDYDPGANPDDPNARLLSLKFACIALDHDALAAQLAAIDPGTLGESHLDRRLLAWHALASATLTQHAGGNPLPEIVQSFETLVATPRLSSLEEWRLLREIMHFHQSIAPLPAPLQSAWDELQQQRAVAREILLSEYSLEENPLTAATAFSLTASDSVPLACLR